MDIRIQNELLARHNQLLANRRKAYAANDMRLVQTAPNREIAITDTNEGTVFLGYSEGIYEITCASRPAILGTGRARIVAPILAALYTVVPEGGL